VAVGRPRRRRRRRRHQAEAAAEHANNTYMNPDCVPSFLSAPVSAGPVMCGGGVRGDSAGAHACADGDANPRNHGGHGRTAGEPRARGGSRQKAGVASAY
jgi:hypothetical protein